ncbi:6-pyruvoyltetrahydropterin/6-carboxytetrahydropterin synthase [Halopelagius inordinatus]|uniref:6-pyruvoyltetrahydropterin/6-carboxytetrahydropterin synthase n=1 Tax=Halopelagius inordinatus TaxID=553467 RepID=A0A1I2P3Z7_9EURY|nr:6-carboxytetrahydropterin synthase [Halopelagius inordinatus]SFG09809.1 6-pyruvoyltetrahydropterin/6-carboxytetrahydropterin synthase [Halopelagius inordinatus]
MYSVAVTRSFVAQHYLTVPDPGPEGELHSHAFELEVSLSGSELGEYGYLVDIDEVKSGIDACLDYFRDATLNDLPEFEGQNPSVERFARAFCRAFVDECDTGTAERVELTLWEDDEAWASYESAL